MGGTQFVFIVSDSNANVCFVLPGAWDLNTHLSDRMLSISLLPSSPGVLSLPGPPGHSSCLVPSSPASGFPELCLMTAPALKISLVCLLQGRGFSKEKLWVRPLTKQPGRVMAGPLRPQEEWLT